MQMSAHDHDHEMKIPLGVLITIATILLLTTIAVAIFRITGQEPAARVPEPMQVVEMRALRFVDSSDGRVNVLEPQADGAERLIHVFQPGDGGFVRGLMRSLARARRASGIGDEVPFTLMQLANGSILLEDPATGQRIDLQAFGPASIESFQALLLDGAGLQ